MLTTRSSDTKQSFFSRYWESLVVVGLLLIAIIIRLHVLDDLFTFTYDQGRDMYVLQKIVRGDPTLIGPTTGLPGVFLGPFMYYFLLPGYLLGNGSPFVVVKWSLIVISLTLPLFYLILRKLVSKATALVVYIMLLLTPGSFEEARQIWNPSLVVPVLLVCTYSLFRSRTQPQWLIVALFMYGLSLQTELAYTVFLAPLIGIWVVAQTDVTLSLLKRLQKSLIPHLPAVRKATNCQPSYSWKMVLLAGCAFGLTLLPQALFELRNDFLITQSYLKESSDPSKTVPLAQVWEQRPALIVEKLFQSLTGETPQMEWVVAAVALSLLVCLFAVRDRRGWFFIGWFCLPLIGMMFHRGNYGYFFGYYITAHYLPALALMALAVDKLPVRKVFLGVFLMIWITMFTRYATFAYNVPEFRYTAALQIKALLRARELQQTPDSSLEVFVPNLLPINYQYLSEWLSRTGQTTPLDFGADGHQEYTLIYESGGSAREVTFTPWYNGWKTDASCTAKEEYGILTLEHCQRP